MAQSTHIFRNKVRRGTELKFCKVMAIPIVLHKSSMYCTTDMNYGRQLRKKTVKYRFGNVVPKRS